MTKIEFICLAKSYKYGGRCIAGIKTDGSGWFRPISDDPTGTLHEEHYLINPYQEPQLFDILRIECTHPSPQTHQPENWQISDKRWKWIGRSTVEQLNNLLTNEVKNGREKSLLFGNNLDRIPWTHLQENPVPSSLCFVKPQEIEWHLRTVNEKRKYRVSFKLGEITYNLSVTDPEWLEIINQMPDGSYPSEDIIEDLQLENFDPDKFLFTISLGEPFQPSLGAEEYCYKLVAAVINATYVKTLLK
ncbi:hypothetical protein PN462_19690 [Spirulina sp. CS-785/01]|uniref:dual OB domain-containing protein n=1 Tax=Spirulina sp. CS-785/01 TaxID=3021716 RepID=UPI00232EACB5|nr:hypothetical protein [Spirulina sp. CS-785/01]MDB9315348.1 hypothetical protein [Spirulina sp. CS-785/01]